MEPIHSFQSPTEVCWQRHCEVMIIFSLFLSFQTNRVCWRSPSRKGQLWQHFRYIRMALSCVTSWHVVALHQHTKRHLTHEDWVDTSEHWGDCLINKASISSAFHVEFTVRWACIWVALIGCLVDQFLIPQAVCQMVYGVLWFMLTLGEVVCVQLAFKCKVLLQFYVFVQVLYV